MAGAGEPAQHPIQGAAKALDEAHRAQPLRWRLVFDRPIGQNQGIQFPIARAYAWVLGTETHSAASYGNESGGRLDAWSAWCRTARLALEPAVNGCGSGCFGLGAVRCGTGSGIAGWRQRHLLPSRRHRPGVPGAAAIHCWRACSRRNGRSFPAANERRDAQCSPRYRPCGRRASTARSCP